jgi:hypothetical protein
MEQEEQLASESEEQFSEEQQQDDPAENFGFRPLPVPQEERRAERITQSPACEAKRQQINRLLCRYPQLKLRSSENTLRQLALYDEAELENILTNAQNDLASIRGAPMADFMIFGVAGMIDQFLLPGYLARCQADEELRNDVEAEATLLFGACGNRTNIAFRAMNNAYIQAFTPEKPLRPLRTPEPEIEPRATRYFQDIEPEDEEGDGSRERARPRRRQNPAPDAYFGVRPQHNG